ncbi:MAG: histidine kinase [Epulopiscium sp.]|nr:histidine kinase [Candidatus Epulonipiscium sp.]
MQSISQKILIKTSIIVIFSLFLSQSFACYYFTQILEKNTLHNDTVKLKQHGLQIDSIVKDIRKLGETIVIDPTIQEFCNHSSPNTFDIDNMVEQLINLTNLNNYIHSSVLITNNGSIYWTDFPYNNNFKPKLKERWYQESEPFHLTNTHYIRERNKNSIKVITYRIPIYNIQQPNQSIGELLLHIDFHYFEKFLVTWSEDFNGYALIDNKQNILFLNTHEISQIYFHTLVDKSFLQKENYTKEKKGYLVKNQSFFDHLQLLAFTSNKNIRTRIHFLFHFFIIFTLCTTTAIILILNPVIHKITHPITELTQAMTRFSHGHMDISISIQSNDELEILGNTFNQMVHDLNQYIQQCIQHEQAKRKMEFELLVSKINPHFIYNTLNSVIYLARKQNNIDIVNMVRAFILILQDGMKIDEDKIFVPLSQEIDVVNAYATIQKYRYKDKFQIIWDIEENLKEKSFPKNVLQPLVENSIFHGIAPMEGKGIIKISAQEQHNNFIITIEDNGIGISKENLKTLFQSNKNYLHKGSVHSIGLNNVQDRIQYLYGNSYGLTIQSIENKGTTIQISIPNTDSSDFNKNQFIS